MKIAYGTGNFPNDHIYKAIASSIVDYGLMDVDTVGRSGFPFFRTDLDSYESMFAAGKILKS